jgi:hypothetical protein
MNVMDPLLRRHPSFGEILAEGRVEGKNHSELVRAPKPGGRVLPGTLDSPSGAIELYEVSRKAGVLHFQITD